MSSSASLSLSTASESLPSGSLESSISSLSYSQTRIKELTEENESLLHAKMDLEERLAISKKQEKDLRDLLCESRQRQIEYMDRIIKLQARLRKKRLRDQPDTTAIEAESSSDETEGTPKKKQKKESPSPPQKQKPDPPIQKHQATITPAPTTALATLLNQTEPPRVVPLPQLGCEQDSPTQPTQIIESQETQTQKPKPPLLRQSVKELSTPQGQPQTKETISAPKHQPAGTLKAQQIIAPRPVQTQIKPNPTPKNTPSKKGGKLLIPDISTEQSAKDATAPSVPKPRIAAPLAQKPTPNSTIPPKPNSALPLKPNFKESPQKGLPRPPEHPEHPVLKNHRNPSVLVPVGSSKKPPTSTPSTRPNSDKRIHSVFQSSIVHPNQNIQRAKKPIQLDNHPLPQETLTEISELVHVIESQEKKSYLDLDEDELVSMELDRDVEALANAFNMEKLKNILENGKLTGNCQKTFSKEYLCRDCKKPFTRRGDRENHEQRLGHVKWKTGQVRALTFATEVSEISK